MSLAAVILAAGEGKRLHTRRAKVLHEVGGRPLIDHVLASVRPLRPEPLVVVVGHLREQVEAHLAGQVRFALQEPPRGTGDAVARALPLLPRDGEVLVLSGDTPLLTTATLGALVALRRQRGAALALATATLEEPAGYGRVMRAHGGVAAIVEARDAGPEEREIREVNAGTYAFELEALSTALAQVAPDNDQGEYYLTDAVKVLVSAGRRVEAMGLADPTEMAGVNTRADLAEVGRLLNARVIRRLLEAGVTLVDPATTWVDADCEVGADTVIEPGVHLRRACIIGHACRLGAHAVLESVTLPDGATVAPLTHRRNDP